MRIIDLPLNEKLLLARDLLNHISARHSDDLTDEQRWALTQAWCAVYNMRDKQGEAEGLVANSIIREDVGKLRFGGAATITNF